MTGIVENISAVFLQVKAMRMQSFTLRCSFIVALKNKALGVKLQPADCLNRAEQYKLRY